MSVLLLLAASAAPVSPGSDWHLVWSDEFDGSTLDRSKWTLADDCFGGGNDERQCYTSRQANSLVHDGQLDIIARREDYRSPAFTADQRHEPGKGEAETSKPFTSARLATAGHAAWLYGYVEVRARLPQGQGTWPAIWMLPEDWSYGRWAKSGEIDIMEAVNLGEPCADCTDGAEDHVLGTIHFGGEPPRNRYIGDQIHLAGGGRETWHTYAIEWSPGSITWFVDGKPYETRVGHEWHTLSSDRPGAPFDRRFHLILNLAIGGHLPEGRNRGGVSEGGFPKVMSIDWVRVWQRDTPADPSAGRNR